MAARKILVVEDEKALLNALHLKLEASGFAIETANNGEDALKKLHDAEYDLMLIDVMMPKKDGFSVVEEYRKSGGKMPIYIMSNLSQPEDLERMKKLDIERYLVKADTPHCHAVYRD